MRDLKNRLVAIVGPTATGKSQLALHLAQTFNGEIVSADSRQVYRHMDIGTAKPDPEELALIPHHLINIINLDDNFSLAQYQELAYRTIEGIQENNKLALLVGVADYMSGHCWKAGEYLRYRLTWNSGKAWRQPLKITRKSFTSN